MYCLRIVSLLALLTASIAQAQSNADKAALRVDADIFTSHLMNGDYGKVMQYQPPALTNEIAKRSGMSAKELLDLTVKSMAEVMMEMDIISSDFDLEETRFITQTEKVYAIIPTSMVITLNDGRNVRITNTTIGIRHNDGCT